MKNKKSKNMLIIYDCRTGKFTYPDNIREQFAANFDERPLWQILKEDQITSANTAEFLHTMLERVTAADTPQVHFAECLIRNTKHTNKWYRIGLVCPVPGETVTITVTDIDEENRENGRQPYKPDCDELTGLLNRNAFSKEVEETLLKNREQVDAGAYALVYLDVIRFKAVNDMFGMAEGDDALRYMADTIVAFAGEDASVCRLDADRFALFVHKAGQELETMVVGILDAFKDYDLPFEITCNVGIYVTTEEQLSVDSMIDRAVLAQSAIKGSYTAGYHYYTETLRKEMLSEQEITGIMTQALAEKQFVLYYQPQYNHSTGMVVGAEALVRWMHPEHGMISPGLFIPIFEKNGFITKLDLYVFEQVCAFIRSCMDKGLPIVPISSNFSRYDIFQPNFVGKLEAIRKEYDVPVKHLRVEITESVVAGGSQKANEIVKELHKYGYIVEMDDFGSGYSSLNVLKDIEMDIIKLDMMFLSTESDSKRGGTILSSMVRMAKWLGMPVIAEGVETVEQADFLRSIGCDYIQGYLYSRPLPQEQYVALLSESTLGTKVPRMNLIETLHANDFWDPKSQETLIFSNYVGGAAIFDYHDGQVEILRVNPKYLQEIGMNLSEKDLMNADFMSFFDNAGKVEYLNMLHRAIETGEEQECETWRNMTSSCCGDEKICIRSTVRMIGKSDENYLFYAMIRNVTTEKHYYAEILDSERRFKMASEQVNIYYWEYNVATKEMRPCFRCMRDLGLPALLTNYPESAIEMGVFPPEVADMYRDWHKQIAEGAKELEAIIPLTAGRVPFRVRYTTEFDESGNPVKAYGSAALVVE